MGIYVNEEKKLFVINTKSMTYAFSLNAENRLEHLYWGTLINDMDSFDVFKEELHLKTTGDNTTFRCYTRNQYEYKANEPYCFNESALDVHFGDGTRGAWLSYNSYRIENDGKTLVVTLKDDYYDFYVDLYYVVYEELDLINRFSVIINKTGKIVKLNKFQSATLHLKTSCDYRLTHYKGHWGAEYQKEQTMLNTGKFVISNNRGNVSGPQAFPAFILDEAGLATETSGELYFGTLHWSGDFKITVEKTEFKYVNICAGINDENTVITLKDGESFETPYLTIGYSDAGIAKMSENLYDYQYNYLLPQNKVLKPRPVLYNAYCTYYNDIDEKKLLDLVPTAAEIGVELFVVDDGWMPKRTGEDAGLGDWVVDTKRFPRGLKSISDEAHKHGMLFGLWVEPEMLNPDSDLFRTHEDWVLHTKVRPYTTTRNQVALNLAREDVCNWAMKMVDNLIIEHQLDYLKWDMNSYITDFGWDMGTEEQKDEMRIKLIKNVYRIWEYITTRHPDVLFENCAHGGARSDYGMLRFSDRINRSDNHNPFDVMLLHETFSTFFIPKLAGGAANFDGNTLIPFEFRKNMAFTGSLSLGFNLNAVSEEERQKYKDAVAEFKKEREDLQDTYVYRLKSAYNSPYVVWEYVKRDRKVVTVFGFVNGKHYNHNHIERILLTGLIKGAKYRCVNDGKIYTEESLTKIGLNLSKELEFNLNSAKIRFEIVE